MRQPEVKCGVLCLICLALSLMVSSCKRDGVGTGDTPVTWPELVQFDEVAFLADGLVRVGDLAAVRESYSELLEAGRKVTVATVPHNAADPQQVEAILGDLDSIISGLETQKLDDDSLKPLVLGLHPVIAKLIEAAGMPHVHANEGPNSGFLFPVFDDGGEQVGTIEIKLHDDAGDLEVWLTRGGYGGEPWRQPLDTTLSLNFHGRDQQLTLAVRDRERNEDESGASTIHQGSTDYFVFPGNSGSDASWLMGADFAAKVELRFTAATTGTFILRPHVHRNDGE